MRPPLCTCAAFASECCAAFPIQRSRQLPLSAPEATNAFSAVVIPTGPGAHSHRGSICNDKHMHAALKSLSGLCMLANRSRAHCTTFMWLKSAGRSASLLPAFRSTHVSCTASAASPSLRQQSALYSAAAAVDYANLGYACICQVRSAPVCRQAAASHDCAQYWPFAMDLQGPAVVPAQNASTAPCEAVHQSNMPCTVSHQLCASVNTWCRSCARRSRQSSQAGPVSSARS